MDHEFSYVVAHAEAREPTFVVREVYGIRLVYYHHLAQPSSELLVIPPGGGLHQLLLQEMHYALGWHLGIHKALSSLLSHVWWLCLSHEASAFVHGCQVCQ